MPIRRALIVMGASAAIQLVAWWLIVSWSPWWVSPLLTGAYLGLTLFVIRYGVASTQQLLIIEEAKDNKPPAIRVYVTPSVVACGPLSLLLIMSAGIGAIGVGVAIIVGVCIVIAAVAMAIVAMALGLVMMVVVLAYVLWPLLIVVGVIAAARALLR